jgi:tetratricopeptide (TPR) repeat protein
VTLVDPDEWLGDEHDARLPGRQLLVDHVHLSFEGNRLLAAAVADAVALACAPRAARSEPPDRDWCADRLAYSRTAEVRMHVELLRRLARPPFTAQITSATDQRRERQMVEALRGLLATERGLANDNARYQHAIELAPGDWVLRQERGRFLQQNGAAVAAVADLERVVAAVPHHAPGHLELAVALSQAGEPIRARKHFGEAIRLDPTDGIAHFDLGQHLVAIGELDAAEESLRRALELRSDLAEIELALGKLLARQERHREAIEHLARARDLDPDDYRARFDRAVSLMALGREEESIEEYLDAAKHARSRGHTELADEIEARMREHRGER